MMQNYNTDRKNWEKALEQLLVSFDVYASVDNGFGQDYELLTKEGIPCMVYNIPKPTTPLKNFFLPVKENVSSPPDRSRRRIIIGIPNCDLEGLGILDEIYLDEDFKDPFYRTKREQTILITADCFGTQEHCHCTSYGIKPWSEGKGDLSLALVDGNVNLTVFSDKGKNFFKEISSAVSFSETKPALTNTIDEKRAETTRLLTESNAALPDYRKTGELIRKSADSIWKKYAAHCVSCGACATICPTCSCFLLIDKPGFEKVKQLDACQYPAFERVAGGEDALHRRYVRFRNRYLCKYVWKPEKFHSIACTGCGRCIEACIGQINKNELFIELSN